MGRNIAAHASNKEFGNGLLSVAADEKNSYSGKAATSLRVVQGRQKNGRVAFTLSCVATLAVALVAVLMLNMSISSGQYYLVRLKNEEKTVRQNNQVLRQEAEKDNVSQNLAARAVKLGMVPLSTAAYLNVHDGTIRGKVKAAQKDQTMEQNVPAPELPDVGVLKPERDESAADAEQKQKRQVPEDLVTGGTVPAPEQRVSGKFGNG